MRESASVTAHKNAQSHAQGRLLTPDEQLAESRRTIESITRRKRVHAVGRALVATAVSVVAVGLLSYGLGNPWKWQQLLWSLLVMGGVCGLVVARCGLPWHPSRRFWPRPLQTAHEIDEAAGCDNVVVSAYLIDRSPTLCPSSVIRLHIAQAASPVVRTYEEQKAWKRRRTMTFISLIVLPLSAAVTGVLVGIRYVRTPSVEGKRPTLAARDTRQIPNDGGSPAQSGGLPGGSADAPGSGESAESNSPSDAGAPPRGAKPPSRPKPPSPPQQSDPDLGAGRKSDHNNAKSPNGKGSTDQPAAGGPSIDARGGAGRR